MKKEITTKTTERHINEHSTLVPMSNENFNVNTHIHTQNQSNAVGVHVQSYQRIIIIRRIECIQSKYACGIVFRSYIHFGRHTHQQAHRAQRIYLPKYNLKIFKLAQRTQNDGGNNSNSSSRAESERKKTNWQIYNDTQCNRNEIQFCKKIGNVVLCVLTPDTIVKNRSDKYYLSRK